MIRRIWLMGAVIVTAIVTSACISVDPTLDGPSSGGESGSFSSTREEPNADADLEGLRADIERQAGGTTEYLVRESDTLASIAERVCGNASSWESIFEANRGLPQPNGEPFDNPNTLQAGFRLAIACSTPAPEAPAGGSAPATDTPTTRTYTVQPGDSLASIAQSQCGTEAAWLDIFEANQPLPDGTPFGDENQLQAGWTIRIDCG